MPDIGFQTAEAIVVFILACGIISFAISAAVSGRNYSLPLLDLLSYSLAGASVVFFAATTISDYAFKIRSNNPQLVERQTALATVRQELNPLEVKYCAEGDSLECREISRLRPVAGAGLRVAAIRKHFDYDPKVSPDLAKVYDNLNDIHKNIGEITSLVNRHVLTSWRSGALAVLIIAYVMGFYRRYVLLAQATSTSK